MEMMSYEEPTSWDDKGMNWNIPDPRRADYVMAIRNAIMERCAAVHTSLPREVMRISPWKPVTVSQVAGIVSAIEQIAYNFLNRDFDGYRDDWSDFPRMWQYEDLVKEDGCRLYEYAQPGDLCEMGGEWLKQIRNAIDKLTVVRCRDAWGTQYARYGMEHDPPFDKSIGTAMERAFDDRTGLSQSRFDSAPTQIYAWSGNTHWKCPQPDREEDENNCNGYCGYATSVSYRFEKVRSWLADRELDFLAYALVTQPTGAVTYAKELTTSVFDAGESRFRRGLNLKKAHVEDPLEMEFDFGNVDSIPKNEVVPTSDFDSEGVAVYRRSAKRGYQGKTWFFLDYGCRNGFNFRSEENG